MKHTTLVLKLVVLLTFVSCTKSRKAELPEDVQADILAISEFSGTYQAERDSEESESSRVSMKALEQSQTTRLSADDVKVPNRLKFMFENLPVSSQTAKKFEIKFLVDKKFVTAFKVVTNAKELTAIEKSLAMTTQEVALIEKSLRATKAELKVLNQSLVKANGEKDLIKMSKKEGSLLVPITKYAIAGYGIIQRTKNELKEDTAVLKLTGTEFKNATHIQIKSLADGRTAIGKAKDFEQLFVESKIDNQVMTAGQLQSNLNIGLKFIDDATQVFTRLDADVLHVYEVTTRSALNETQARLLKNNAGNQEIIACSDESVKAYINSSDKECVLLLKADVPVSYTTVELAKANDDGSESGDFEVKKVPRSQSVGLVEIQKNVAAVQKDVSGALDPDSAVRLADLKGEFFYRRTFEAASNMFLGRTGTSGDMLIVQFELEDKRLVVRSQQSLIKYTGQGPKDREEIMSFPVKYVRMNKVSANGAALTIPVAEATTKEKAEYAIIDWTYNTVPNASSPLAFYADGACFLSNSSQRVTDTDMRLAKDGVLNFSLSGSYTMQPTTDCIAMKDVNSAYWSGTYQFNYNIVERISFKKHINKASDIQFATNISSMAQEAFNFGTFGLADLLAENGTITNRDNNEKYMPIIHDFRKGKKLKYYLGGLNTEATNPERKKMLIEATRQVVDEWNATLHISFKGTDLERKENYIELVVDDGSTDEPIGHLGDLDRNYIWLQELPAENGLLGVAQPAANPRSGTIESANVIVYTGNTLNQARRLLKLTALSREYEIAVEQMRKTAIEQAKIAKTVVASKDIVAAAAQEAATKTSKVNTAAVGQIKSRSTRIAYDLNQVIKALQLNSLSAKTAIKNMKMRKSPMQDKKILSQENLRELSKGEKVNYEVNQTTFLKKITELAMNKNLLQNKHEFELAVNNAFMKFGGMDEQSKAILQKRSEQLAMAVRFDKKNANRPGCFKYSRDDANDQALMMDPDPEKNLMMNFKVNVMSTLSHELGHAFGLLHNYRGSTDKTNYEFGKEETGRNYSSIMDYISDIDQNYFGPGPYDAHAIRAAYTGLVEVTEQGSAKMKELGAKLVGTNLVSIEDIMKAADSTSLVHFTKDTINATGMIKHYAQCSDGGVGRNALCAQFDVGGSASEIVKNRIADYHRGYISRNYVHDKINFGWTQKMESINRNISLFQSIRGYLDEAVMSIIQGSGRTTPEDRAETAELTNAARMGYQFFHEVLRTPDASGISAGDKQNRFIAVPYQYLGSDDDLQTNSENCVKGEKETIACSDIKVLESRSLYDISMSRDKLDTIGIGYDKIFAMQFLLQASSAPSTDDSNLSTISYLDFEQWFMGIQDPSQSPTINTMLQIMSGNLAAGFYTPNRQLMELRLPVEINRYLGEQTAIASVIGLFEAKRSGFDPYAEAFKVGSAYVSAAPKDRLNVVRTGQVRDKSDSRVMFAVQNGVASDVLVRVAATSEVLLENRDILFKLMADLYTADLPFRKLLATTMAEQVSKACPANAEGKVEETAACKTAREKTVEMFISENAEIAKLKVAGDRVAILLVAKLRELNSKEAIMSLTLDKEDNVMNFASQVEYLRSMMSRQIGLVVNVLEVLTATPPEQLQATISGIIPQLQQIKAQNSELESVPLFSLSHAFMTGFVSNLKAKLQNKTELSGETVVRNMMDGKKLQESQVKILEALGKLSLYTGLIDPESSIK